MATSSAASPSAASALVGNLSSMSLSSSSSTNMNNLTPSIVSASSSTTLSTSANSNSVSSSSAMLVNDSTYDWLSDENQHKWRSVLVNSLEKVLRQVHPTLVAHEEALLHVESLIMKLLSLLTAKPIPTSIADIEDRVSKTFPTPIDKWALVEAQQAIEKGKRKSSLVLPVDKVHQMLKEALQIKIDEQVTLYIVAVLEYISADILKLAGNYVKNYRHVQITCQDIKVAMCADKVLMDMFQQETVMIYNDEETETKRLQTYDEVVRDIILDEKQYLRDLNMLTKVFKEILQKGNMGTTEEIDSIFSNISEITELTVTLISSLEDTLEMTEEGHVPAIGPCFEELAEAQEFDVYDKYTRDILAPTARKTLERLVPKQICSDALRPCGKGFREAIKFCLPKLLLGPIYHCFHYFNYIELLRKLTDSSEESDTLQQVGTMLSPLKHKLKQAVQNAGPAAKRKPGDIYHRIGPSRMSRNQSLQKLNQLQQSIVNWDGPNLSQVSSELICEGQLKVLDQRKRLIDRYVFLCDGVILICKINVSKRSSVSSHQGEYRLREKHEIRKLDVLDREDATGSEAFTFELAPREGSKIVFKAESEEEKNSWMAALVMLNTKFMLERLLDALLAKEEENHPLRFPPKEKYPFAEENSSQNIVFEVKEKSGVPLIKGATLIKLVERLTYHVYADPMFIKTFLTTFRSFSTPRELLDLLIARFNIPEPEFSSDSESDSEIGDKTNKIRITMDIKRFHKEYRQPVQFRVINVLKHWTDQHFYDFEQDEVLLDKLKQFLNEISGKSMKKWVDCIAKIVNRRETNTDKDKDIHIVLDRSPPPIEHHIEDSREEGWPELLIYHPIEIARQLTLLEFQYYRAVKPSELVDLAWTGEDKDERSPNLLRMVRHSNNFTRYLVKTLVETENLEERVAVVQRTLEIMVVLQEYNNFNGVLAITAAFSNSAVHRLSFTKDRIPNNLLKALEEATSIIKDHFKVYWEKLRSINPPCVPFFGQYQTNILHLEEGNPDFLVNNTNLINFTKRRKVAEIISEIQQYQNQPYCLATYPELKTFLERIDPSFPGMTEREENNYLYAKSLEIEPRNPDAAQKKKMLEGKVRWKGLPLRSPGIKPKNLPGKMHPKPLPRINKHSSRNSQTIISSDNDPGTASDSPLTSPIFHSSPSGPSTPLLPPNSANSPPDSDPIKFPVILPQSSSTVNSPGGPHSASALPPSLPPPSSTCIIPPPLPPKPSSSRILSSSSDLPPVPLRSSSPPPPPLPPRSNTTPHWRDHNRQARM